MLSHALMFLVSPQYDGNGLSAAAEEILRTVGRILTEYEEVCGKCFSQKFTLKYCLFHFSSLKYSCLNNVSVNSA